MNDTNQSRWIVVCKHERGAIVKVVGTFESDGSAHDWRDEHWDKYPAEIRKVLPP